MADTLTILGISGSLRAGSYNTLALKAAMKLVPDQCRIEPLTLEGIPPFNQDLEQTPPPAVVELKKRIRATDAVLFVTPEYNYSLPGVLKNAIDHASRPHGDSAWKGKPCAIMGASVGAGGTMRAQYHLRQVLVTLDMPAVLQPEVIIRKAQDLFDADGTLKDETTTKLIRQLLAKLVDLTRRMRA